MKKTKRQRLITGIAKYLDMQNTVPTTSSINDVLNCRTLPYGNDFRQLNIDTRRLFAAVAEAFDEMYK